MAPTAGTGGAGAARRRVWGFQGRGNLNGGGRFLSMRTLWLLGWAIGVVGGALRAAEFSCAWADTPPVIDGRADEAVWAKAQVVDAWRQPWAPGAPAAKEGTRARLLWDREWLYFTAELADADIAADSTEHDGPLWQNDVFEIFLKPSEQHPGYYEFEVNPAGAIVDAFFPEATSRREPGILRRGTFRVEAKVTLRGTLNRADDRDDGWTVEGRIPWSDFAACGGRPAPGETWRVNFARVNGRGAAQELSSAVGLTKPNFHLTENYGALRFEGPAPIARAAWAGSGLLGSPEPATGYAVTPAWPRLAANAMVALAPSPDGAWLWFVDQSGGRPGSMRVGRVRTDGDGSDAEILLEPDEQITSVVFHPKFAENGFVYFGANGPRAQRPRFSRVVRYTVRDGRPDAATRLTVIEWPSDGHNGGGLAFGGDGLLFVTSGDGTSEGDRDRVGQDPASMRAKILRIDVDRPSPGKHYSVPADNPFVGDARFVPETWAYGLRNPWRLTYDAASGQMWAGENGQDAWEFAHLVRRGANYGWAAFEGSHRYHAGRALGPTPVSPPTVEFPHSEFRSLTGGVVYRGKALPELTGAYVFGDFGTGRLWAAKHDGTKLEWVRELADTPLALTHVTAGADGELLLADYGFERARTGPKGGIHRVGRATVAAAGATRPFPARLSGSGLFADTVKLAPAAGVTAYAIHAPGWHDGAQGAHHLALPEGAAIEVGGGKTWEPPNGTVLAQTLSLAGRRIETRVLVKQQEDWAGYTYVWAEDQRDADLAVKGGADRTLANGQAWRVPSRAECMMCHSREANFSLTLREPQLTVPGQLERWEAMGLLRVEAAEYERARRRFDGAGGRGGGGGGGRAPGTVGGRGGEGGGRGGEVARAAPAQRAPVVSTLLPRAPERMLRYAKAGDTAAPLELRARSYLAVNCSVCHAPSGGGNSAMNFEWGVPRERMQAIDEVPQHGDLGIQNARVIAPGTAGRSVIVPRMGIRGPGQMPPVASRAGDAEGLRVIVEWIQSLGTTQ